MPDNDFFFNVVSDGSDEEVRSLLTSPIDPTWRGPYGLTHLHCAAQRGHIPLVTHLLTLGAAVDAQDDVGNTPLKLVSAEPHHWQVVPLLLGHGADPNLSDNRGFTPLHCAARHGFLNGARRIADLLIEAGADVNARSSPLGFVPLHEAYTTAMVRLLLASGADPTIENADGLTPGEYLEDQGHHQEAKLLMELVKPKSAD